MKISKKSLKAVEAVLDVAILGALKPITLAEVSRRREISLSYLEQMFRKLRQHGLVRSTRGPGGGYCLNRRLSAISIADIVCAVDGRDAAVGLRHGKESDLSPTRNLWSGLNDHLQDYLRSVTLASLLDAAMVEEKADSIQMPPAGTAEQKSSSASVAGNAMGIQLPQNSSTRNSALV